MEILQQAVAAANKLGIIVVGTQWCEATIEIGRLLAGQGISVELCSLNPFISFDQRHKKYDDWFFNALNRTVDLPEAGQLKVKFFDVVTLRQRLQDWYTTIGRSVMKTKNPSALLGVGDVANIYEFEAQRQIDRETNDGAIEPSYREIPITIAGYLPPDWDGNTLELGYSLKHFGIDREARDLPFKPEYDNQYGVVDFLLPSEPQKALLAFWVYTRIANPPAQWR